MRPRRTVLTMIVKEFGDIRHHVMGRGRIALGLLVPIREEWWR
jgi:hypothetical protein